MNAAILPIATRLQCEARALAAVIAVESSGSGLINGRAVIRLEVNHFWSNVPETKRPLVDARFKVLGPKPWEGHQWFDGAAWVPLHVGQEREWKAWDCAAGTIDQDAAVRATSWGLGQVMGEWHALGYASAQDFLVAQATTEGQMDTMARFIAARPSLLKALRARDWTTFAAGYNGTGKVADYAGKLAAAYKAAA